MYKPNKAELTEYEKFNEGMFLKYERGDRLLRAGPVLRFFQNKRFNIALDLVNLKETHKILDVGFGTGELLRRIKSGELHGIDISEAALVEAKEKLRNKNVTLKKAFVEDIPYPDSTFDVVFCMEVMEHVLEPSTAVLELKRVLKQKGTLIITTPSPLLESIKKPIFRLKLNKIFLKGVDQNPEAHLRTFTRSTLSSLLKSNGFKIVKVFYFPFFLFGETIVLKATKL